MRVRSQSGLDVEFELHSLKRSRDRGEALEDPTDQTLVGRLTVPLAKDDIVWDSPPASGGADPALDRCVAKAREQLSGSLSEMMRNLFPAGIIASV